ncbi:MAG: lysylphosphatidylglycerol synthase transmembrane domain-containing protein [Acidobacteria bacterium]|nr:lysylphosphatidylglycerol synthase transmembrane domain-containing protein [Acidobacteriota bacterium]
MKEGRRRGWAFLAIGLVLAGAAAYAFSTNPAWRRFNLDEFLESFHHVRVGFLLLAVGAIFSTYAVRALRWRLLLRPVKRDAGFGNILSATIIGFGAIGVLGRAGEVARVYLIARSERTPVSSQLAIWVLERSFDTLMVLAGVVFALGQVAGADSPAGNFIGAETQALTRWVAAAIVLILVLLITLRRYYDAITGKLLDRAHKLLHAKNLGSLEKGMRLFGEGLHGLRDFKTVFGCLTLTILHWLLVVATFHAILIGCLPEMQWRLYESTVFTGLVMTGSLLQIPGVGGGFQVAVVLVLTELFGVPVEPATSAALLSWLVSFMAVILPALVLMARQGLRWANLSELESEV